MVKKRKWSEDEYVRLINGAIRHHSSPNMFISIYNDLVYNFFLTRSLRNAINDGWRVLLINGTNLEIIEKAIKWKPSQLPLNEHVKLISDALDLKDLYTSVYASCLANFKDISYDQFLAFFNEFLDGIDYSVEDISEILVNIDINVNSGIDNSNPYKFAEYFPLEGFNGVYVLEPSPPIIKDIRENSIPFVEVVQSKMTSKGHYEKEISSLKERVTRVESEVIDLKEELKKTKSEAIITTCSLSVAAEYVLESLKKEYKSNTEFTINTSFTKVKDKDHVPSRAKFVKAIEELVMLKLLFKRTFKNKNKTLSTFYSFY